MRATIGLHFREQGYVNAAVARVPGMTGVLPVWDRKKIPLTTRANNLIVVKNARGAPFGGWDFKIPITSSL